MNEFISSDPVDALDELAYAPCAGELQFCHGESHESEGKWEVVVAPTRLYRLAGWLMGLTLWIGRYDARLWRVRNGPDA